eukprot:scaffold625_cov420-Prasinococcus_capsulatus_cf.AAC.65
MAGDLASTGDEARFHPVELGDALLHLLNTSHGKMFVMSEVAQVLFQESPHVFAKDLRAERYAMVHSHSKAVVATMQHLHLPAEGKDGAALLSPDSVEQLLGDRRKPHLIKSLKLALVNLSSQEAARLMSAGQYGRALPLAMEAVKQGRAIFTSSAALQLFPLYLLASQANLGLKRATRCEELLCLASWWVTWMPVLSHLLFHGSLSVLTPGKPSTARLLLHAPHGVTNVMRSQLSRQFGQLYAQQGKGQQAIKAFAEEVYHCSLEYGPYDVRTSFGYHNLGRTFRSNGDGDKGSACSRHVVRIWTSAIQKLLETKEPWGPNTFPLVGHAIHKGMYVLTTTPEGGMRWI